MIIRVIEVQYLYDYVLHLKVNNGVEGEIDLKGGLNGEIFEPLCDKKNFRAFRLHQFLNENIRVEV